MTLILQDVIMLIDCKKSLEEPGFNVFTPEDHQKPAL